MKLASASFMPASCQLHASFMPASCQLHASFMPASCQLHASFMPASCRVPLCLRRDLTHCHFRHLAEFLLNSPNNALDHRTTRLLPSTLHLSEFMRSTRSLGISESVWPTPALPGAPRPSGEETPSGAAGAKRGLHHSTGILTRKTPEHCLVNGGFPLFWRKKPCCNWLKNVDFKEPCSSFMV